MSSWLHYFAEKHLQLAEHYQGDCLATAREIARLLIEDGKDPFIGLLVKKEMLGENKFYHALLPKKYEGRITWTKHYVCCCDAKVYDPMFEEPLDIGGYSQRAFGLDISIRTFIPKEIMNKYVNQRCESKPAASHSSLNPMPR
jgi:hypothetical protein